MPTNLFQDPTKTLPKKADSQIVRVDMEEDQMSGRKNALPSGHKASDMTIKHVPNAGSKT